MDLARLHSIHVNQQWQLIFRWDGECGRLTEFIWIITATDESEAKMLTTKRKPATVGEILTEEFMQPMSPTQSALAEAMGVQRKHVNELCRNRRNVTAATALILARVFGQQPGFLAECAAAQRSLGGDEYAQGA